MRMKWFVSVRRLPISVASHYTELTLNKREVVGLDPIALPDERCPIEIRRAWENVHVRRRRIFVPEKQQTIPLTLHQLQSRYGFNSRGSWVRDSTFHLPHLQCALERRAKSNSN